MAMLRLISAFVFGIALLGGLAANQDRAPQPGVAGKNDSEAIDKFLQTYVAAFNKNQSDAVAEFWTPQCVYVDRETGERTEGRDAIRKDMEKLFKENPGAKITVELGATRFIRPDVATIEGHSTAHLPKLEPTSNDFSAVLVKEGDRWLIDNVQETGAATPPTPASALRELEWLVGDWVDDTPGITVSCSTQWAANQSFLLRSFKVQKDKEEPWEGTQVIGWDPRSKQIRSWTFDSDGSFDEGLWSKHGETWSVVLTRTLENGGMATGTQVIKKLSNDAYTVHTVAREINGEPVPATDPIKVVRVVKKPADSKQ
jgi:uncharacterized protein (TIGR02246 family)